MIQSNSFRELEKNLVHSFVGLQKHYEKISVGLPKDYNGNSNYLSDLENVLIGEIFNNQIIFLPELNGSPIQANQIKVKIQFGQKVKVITPHESLKSLFQETEETVPVLYQERLPIEKIEVFCHETAKLSFIRAVRFAENRANKKCKEIATASFEMSVQHILENDLKKEEKVALPPFYALK